MRLIQGHRPGRLTEAGRQQARDLGCALRAHGLFDVILSSDLERARETADLIAKEIPPCPIRHDARLRERGYGPLEGQPVFSLKRLLVENRTDLRGLNVPGGEDYAHFEQRVAECFEEVVSGACGNNVLVVTHAGVARVIMERFLAMPPRTTDNCEAIRISIAGDRTLQAHPL